MDSRPQGVLGTVDALYPIPTSTDKQWRPTAFKRPALKSYVMPFDRGKDEARLRYQQYLKIYHAAVKNYSA